MWRREVIRLVLAANWIVFAISCNGAFGHGHAWKLTGYQLLRAERGLPPAQGVMWWVEEDRPQVEGYQAHTEVLYRSGQTGWRIACGASFGTAVLLMIAFPKKPS